MSRLVGIWIVMLAVFGVLFTIGDENGNASDATSAYYQVLNTQQVRSLAHDAFTQEAAGQQLRPVAARFLDRWMLMYVTCPSQIGNEQCFQINADHALRPVIYRQLTGKPTGDTVRVPGGTRVAYWVEVRPQTRGGSVLCHGDNNTSPQSLGAVLRWLNTHRPDQARFTVANVTWYCN